MKSVLQDMKYSLRVFRLSPGFTATALAALALGIGANTAIFSVVNAVLLRPLPYPHPERIVQVLSLSRSGAFPYTNVPRFNAYRAQSRVFEDVTAYDWRGGEAISLTVGDSSEQVRGEHVSFEYFRLFGPAMVAGRGFTAEEDRPGGGRVVVLSGGYWQRRFGSDGSLVGKSILLGGDPYTVVGIVSPAFAPDPPVDLWIPLQADPNSTDQATFLFAAARLKPGVTLDRAKAALHLAAQEFRREFPGAIGPTDSFTVEPLRQYMTGEVRPALLILLAAVACVLCIACANVANLLLARATGRAREMAIRAAIGAGRARIIRQLLVESVTLSLAGGAPGLVLGYAGVRALLRLNAGGIPRLGLNGSAVTLDARVLVFTLLVSLVTGILFGLAPALRASRVDLNTALKDSGPRSGERGHNRTRRLIIVAEIALAFVLLTGAGLLLRSFAALGKVALGFDSRNVLTMESALNGTRFDHTASIASTVRQCEERIAAIPGVEAVAAAPSVPLESSIGMPFVIADRPLGDRPFHGSGWWRYVTWGYFDVYKIPILRGRGFTVGDDASAPPVALIDAAMARKYWPDRNPIGQRIRLDGDPHTAEPYREIVGVVADVQELGLRPEPGAAAYVPLPQVSDSVMMHVKRIVPLTWAVRTKVPPFSILPAVQQEMGSAGGIPIGRVRSMDQIVAQSTAGDRFDTVLLGIFAFMAIMLASIGLYGVIAYSMQQRTREFGIRVALGAGVSQLRNRIVLEAIGFAAMGTLIGLAAALAVTRFMTGLLYGVKATDPLILTSVALILLAVAVLASLLPARRAARIDPIVALRYE